MKRSITSKVFLVVLCECLLHSCIGQDSGVVDITNIRENGCRWSGGLSTGVTCNCLEGDQNMIIHPTSIPSFDTTFIEINNCHTVHFTEHSIATMRNLRTLSINNIHELKFDTKSLNWYGYKDVENAYEERLDLSIPSLTVHVNNCNVTKVSQQTFSGRIREIHFSAAIIEDIQPFAFSNLLQTERISFTNVLLLDVKLQAFKKFTTEFLELNTVTAHTLPSRAFSDVVVYQSFIISNCTFNSIRSGAISILNPTSFILSDTKIERLDGEAFKVLTRGDVLFRNNTFGIIHNDAFAAIRINRDETLSERSLTFETNTFNTLTRNSLHVNDFRAIYIDININETCDCESIFHNLKETEYYSEIRCYYINEFVTVREYKANMCSILTGYYSAVILVCIVLFLLALIAIGLYLYYKLVYKTHKYGSDKASKGQNGGTLSLIVPDGRTYKETELHVIVEKADLLTTDL